MARSSILVLLVGTCLGCSEPRWHGGDEPANAPTGAPARGARAKAGAIDGQASRVRDVPVDGDGADADAGTCAVADRHAPWLRDVSFDVRVWARRRSDSSEPILWTYTSCVGPFLLRGPCDSPDPMGASRADRGPPTIGPVIDELVNCLVPTAGSILAEPGREATVRFEIGTDGLVRQHVHGPGDRSSRCMRPCAERAARQIGSLRIGPQTVEVVTVASGGSNR